MVRSKQLCHFQGMYLSARLRLLPMFGNLRQVVEQPKTVNQKTICSIDQVMMEARRKNCLEMFYLCAVFLLKGDAHAIELSSIIL